MTDGAEVTMVEADAIERIVDQKKFGEEVHYKIRWKESWVPRTKLTHCFKHIEEYFLEKAKDVEPKPQTNPLNVQEEEQQQEKDLVVPNEAELRTNLDDVEVAKVISDVEALNLDTQKKEESVDCKPDNKVEAKVEENPAIVSASKVDALIKKPDIQIPESQSWYANENVRKQLLKFYDKFAKTPTKEINKAKVKHEIYMKMLEVELKEEGWCKKLEYTGSSYEGLKITEDGLEFDVMFVIDGKGLETSPIPNREGYCNLHMQEGVVSKLFASFGNQEGMLMPKKMISEFFSVLQRTINKLKYEKLFKLRIHGPAVQMDVNDDKGNFWYSVDLVPSVEVKVDASGKVDRFVPKPINEPEIGNMLENSWRCSFSKEEKDLLKGLDTDNGCRRQVVRIMKTLCKRESTLKALTSYHLKTVLFHMLPVELSWKSIDLTERLFDMLGALEFYLSNRNLPQYFIPSMNLIATMKPTQLANIIDRIKTLRTSENKFIKAINF